jgi:RHS repeat-associated protein
VFTPTGQVIGRSDYLPFGDTLNQSGALPKQRFTGQERDGEAGLDYFNARLLQMRTGRMNRPDPLFGDGLANPQQWNRYAYVGNNPLVFVDPSGNQAAAPLVFRSGVELCLSCQAQGVAGVHPDVQSSVFDTLFHLNFAFESGGGGSVSVGASSEGRGGGGAAQMPEKQPGTTPLESKDPVASLASRIRWRCAPRSLMAGWRDSVETWGSLVERQALSRPLRTTTRASRVCSCRPASKQDGTAVPAPTRTLASSGGLGTGMEPSRSGLAVSTGALALWESTRKPAASLAHMLLAALWASPSLARSPPAFQGHRRRSRSVSPGPVRLRSIWR